ncbi:MAG: hypothetical protein R3A12_18045 [Ignavibacteria bacterium]
MALGFFASLFGRVKRFRQGQPSFKFQNGSNGHKNGHKNGHNNGHEKS